MNTESGQREGPKRPKRTREELKVRASFNGDLVERDVDDSGDEALRLSDRGRIIYRC
jgi:hypothetical protein